MAPDDMLAGKRPRLDYLDSAGLHTASSATQNRNLLPAPESPLPVELITIILKLRFPNYHRSIIELYGLKLVSKAWKELIEHTPSFWTYISADYPTTVIQDCLRLSRNHFLHVEISYSLFDDVPKDLKKKLQILQLHAERWEELRYNIRESSADDQLIRDFLESPAPNLQSLVALLRDSTSSPPPTLNLAGGKTNKMKDLRLKNVSLPWSSQLLTGLETFSLTIEGTVPVEEIVNIFINSPGLRSFHLSYRSAGGQDITALPNPADSNTFHVTANSLEEVNICFDDPRIASQILSRVFMPACRSLKLEVKPLAMMDAMLDDIHSLTVACSQFVPKIGQTMSQGGRTTFYVWPEQPFEWRISSGQELFRFSLEFSRLSLDEFIEYARNLAEASGFQLELEVYLGPTPQWIADELGGWSEITKLNVPSPSNFCYDLNDEAVRFPDYLGQTRVGPGPGLSWPFPDLQELDLSELECPLLTVFDMLNRRYLSSSDVQRMEDLEIPIDVPSKLDIRVRDTLEWKDALIVPALESHRGVKMLESGCSEE